MKKLNHNIQGMRGVCALMVFGGHVTAAFDNPWLYSQYNPLRAFLDGHAAVIFFFMLSGYFYYTNQCISLKKYAKMLVKRVLHLTPPARPRTAVWGCIIEGRTAITTPPKPL